MTKPGIHDDDPSFVKLFVTRKSERTGEETCVSKYERAVEAARVAMNSAVDALGDSSLKPAFPLVTIDNCLLLDRLEFGTVAARRYFDRAHLTMAEFTEKAELLENLSIVCFKDPDLIIINQYHQYWNRRIQPMQDHFLLLIGNVWGRLLVPNDPTVAEVYALLLLYTHWQNQGLLETPPGYNSTSIDAFFVRLYECCYDDSYKVVKKLKEHLGSTTSFEDYVLDLLHYRQQ